MKQLLFFVFCSIPLLAFSGDKEQKRKNSEAFVYEITKVDNVIEIDGEFLEEDWKSTESTSPFINKWPQDSGLAEAKTSIKLLYDDNFIYVSAICYQKDEDVIIQTLKRDNLDGFWGSDGISVVLDPINQKSNGFLFSVNAGGAQMEASLNVNGTRTRLDANWDNKWFSEVKKYEDRWVVEMAIPFKTLRYNDSKSTWGINFIRNDMKRNIYSTWAQVPINFNGIDLGHTGTLQWEGAPKKTSSNIALIPYTSGGISKNHEDNENTRSNFDIGGDAKIALTSSLNLDITLNPDFSNVDVDQQVTNVSRFSVFFPEKRSFFLENSDLFTGFGSWGVRPFFSRRIGLDDGDQIPILFGARITGNITDGMRIGIMDVQTRSTEDLNAHNFLVTSVQQRVFKRSTIKFLFNNKQEVASDEKSVSETYNRTGGLEFQYTSENGKLSSSIRAHTSTTEEHLDENMYYSASFNYNDVNFYSGFNYDRVQENYITEMGFVPRLNHYDAEKDTTIRIGYNNINPWIGYKWYGKHNDKFREQEVSTWTVMQIGTNGEFMGRRTSVNYSRLFLSNFRMRVEFMDFETRLMVPADLIDSNIPLPIGTYKYSQFRSRFETDRRKKISVKQQFNYGSFFNGTRLELSTELNIRQQPWGVFGLAYRINKIKLAENYGEATIHLAGPRAEISFNNNMSWTTFLQYNTQDENFNINSRFQWRYKPMSDIFIVYSDNYATTNFSTKNRGIVFKMTYWLNL